MYCSDANGNGRLFKIRNTTPNMWEAIEVFILLMLVKPCLVEHPDDDYSLVFSFDYDQRVCAGFPSWVTLDDGESIEYVPKEVLSCISSPNFKVTRGFLEANVYMNTVSSDDCVTIFLYEKSESGNDTIVKRNDVLASDPHFVPGLQISSMDLSTLTHDFYGYVSYETTYY